MNKSKFFCAIIIAISFISQMNISFAQDSAKSKSSEEFTALKKGNFAFYLEFGSMLFKTGGSGIFDSDYEMLLTAKYHLSERTALRISGGSIIGGGSGVFENYNYNSGTYENYSPDRIIASFNASVNLQHFLSLKSKVKPFFSLGIYSIYYYDSENEKSYWFKTETWGIGPYASFGAEMFVLDNISILGEYILRGTAGKSYHKSLNFNNNNSISSESYSYSTNYMLELKTFRAGLSIYF